MTPTWSTYRKSQCCAMRRMLGPLGGLKVCKERKGRGCKKTETRNSKEKLSFSLSHPVLFAVRSERDSNCGECAVTSRAHVSPTRAHSKQAKIEKNENQKRKLKKVSRFLKMNEIIRSHTAVPTGRLLFLCVCLTVYLFIAVSVVVQILKVLLFNQLPLVFLFLYQNSGQTPQMTN